MNNHRKIISFFLCSLLFLSSCDIRAFLSSILNSSSQSTTSAVTSSIPTSTSSLSTTTSSSSYTSNSSNSSHSHSTTSNTTSTTSSISPVAQTKTIKEINILCDSLPNNEINNPGEEIVTFTGKMKFAVTTITTKTGYRSDNQYKLFVFDNTGFIYVGVNQNNYTTTFSKYEYADTSYYKFTGIINKYLGLNEVIMTSFEFLKNYSGTKFEDNLIKNWAIDKSILEIGDIASKLSLNCKGICYSSTLVKFNAYCYDYWLNDASVLMGKDDQVLSVHGDNKLHNLIKTGESHTIYGVVTTHLYKTGIQFLCEESCKEVQHDYTQATQITKPSDFYLNKYKSGEDSTEHVKSYETASIKVYKVDAYISEISKSGKTTFCLSDNIIQNSLTMNNCGDQTSGKKTLVCSNKSLENLSSSDASPFDGYNENVQYTFYFAMDIYNTSHYFQINILNIDVVIESI